MREGALSTLRSLDLTANNASKAFVHLAQTLKDNDCCPKLRTLVIAQNTPPGDRKGGVPRAFRDKYFREDLKLQVVTE